MADSQPLLEIPPGEVALTVRMVNPVNFGPAIVKRFMEPPVPGYDKKKPGPVLTFLLEHPSRQKLVFDLGIRKDCQNYAPVIANYIPTTNYDIQVEKNLVEILHEGGVSGESIDAIIWRYVASATAFGWTSHGYLTTSSVTGIGTILEILPASRQRQT